MSTTVNTGWLNDKNGDKFAPKTLSSQVMTADGISLENKIENDLSAYVEKAGDTMTGTLRVPTLNIGGGATLSYNSSLNAIVITFV